MTNTLMTASLRCALALTALLCAAPLRAQPTAWPDYMAVLQAGVSESPVAAALPADVAITPPAPGTPPEQARWSGLWSGWGCRNRACDARLAVEKVGDGAATVVYAGAAEDQKPFSERAQGRFEQGELRLPLAAGRRAVLRMRADGDVEFTLWRADGALQLAGVLTRKPAPYSRSVERVATPWTQDGRPQTLEMVVFRPAGSGPFPTLVFNHGSTGAGNRPDWFTATWTAPELATWFTARGWQVLFPQRRGRGKSDGLYDEGFEPDRSYYACRPELSLPGLERAMADLDVVMAQVLARPDVDKGRLLVGGISRGGILSAAYAGTRPQQPIRGVLNFVGGWSGERCAHSPEINGTAFKHAAAYAQPMLWLYGDRDPFYSLRHSRRNHEAFTAAGGQGAFIAYDTPAGGNGHLIHYNTALWQADMERYLEQLGLPAAPR